MYYFLILLSRSPWSIKKILYVLKGFQSTILDNEVADFSMPIVIYQRKWCVSVIIRRIYVIDILNDQLADIIMAIFSCKMKW